MSMTEEDIVSHRTLLASLAPTHPITSPMLVVLGIRFLGLLYSSYVYVLSLIKEICRYLAAL